VSPSRDAVPQTLSSELPCLYFPPRFCHFLFYCPRAKASRAFFEGHPGRVRAVIPLPLFFAVLIKWRRTLTPALEDGPRTATFFVFLWLFPPFPTYFRGGLGVPAVFSMCCQLAAMLCFFCSFLSNLKKGVLTDSPFFFFWIVCCRRPPSTRPPLPPLFAPPFQNYSNVGLFFFSRRRTPSFSNFGVSPVLAFLFPLSLEVCLVSRSPDELLPPKHSGYVQKMRHVLHHTRPSTFPVGEKATEFPWVRYVSFHTELGAFRYLLFSFSSRRRPRSSAFITFFPRGRGRAGEVLLASLLRSALSFYAVATRDTLSCGPLVAASLAPL